MYGLARAALFNLDAELSHELTMWFLKHSQHNVLKSTYAQNVPNKPVECFGIEFPNPVGLAAGLDKNGECIDAFAAMGFGFIEIGTVTPKPQVGNDKPRLFRIKDAKGIINRMGFNNKGVDYLVEQVKQSQFNGVLGINIGKNKATPEENALDDYLICLEKVYPYASYVTVNISSPNTPGLRNLQYGEALDSLLAGLKAGQEKLSEQHGKKVPMLVKIAPDLTSEEIQSIADSLRKAEVEGVIATNTTISRDNIEGLRYAKEAGGLSGLPLQERSLQVTKELAQALQGELPIVSVGGIDSAESAQARFDAGASLVQCYSAFIYQGPELIRNIVQGIR
ncbi:quinone-dependent dihydroorotate dehydrogenase [Paraneptunicella aestuarii]|uniref:quinone-dependent dihydroorotate dehydrogenase n=1 Tax=Paraneptunicella aestuarii TaxID=2831148 RepID=UPI001E45D5A8|nr:quinone-dependent dihydroorotate dehydrogenase [Paraneptunicella aestuarii]UAA37146.1 quinone-dependent dihydroorotate dehydrogenase [Paraneptunicella aestuarii]